MSTPSFGAADESFEWLGGARVRVVLPGRDCAARLSVLTIQADTGYAAATHTHSREDEVFVVLDGTLTVWAGDQRQQLLAGGRVFLPRGLPHGYRVDAGPARVLNVCTPGGLDEFFREVAAGAALDEAAARFGITYA
jgi:quercetin dioxygenase-like cupin family protein